MNALDEGQRGRYNTITRTLKDARQELRELGDGYAFRFKAESQLIQDAAEFIVYERLCYPFLILNYPSKTLMIRSGFAFADRKALRNLFAANLISSSEKFCPTRINFQPPRGAYIMKPTPTRQITPPMMSQMSGFTPSIAQPQKIDKTTNTPP